MHWRRLRDAADGGIVDQLRAIDGGSMAGFSRVRRIGEANYAVFALSRRFWSVGAHCSQGVRFTDTD